MEVGITDQAPEGLECYREKNEVLIDGVMIPGLVASYFKKYIGPHTITMGVYRTRAGKNIFRSWGVMEDERCCRFHQIADSNGVWLPSIPGSPSVAPYNEGGKVLGLQIEVSGTLRIFKIEAGA